MFFSRKAPPIVISIGGSLIAPNGGLDTQFLNTLNTFIRKQVKNGHRFFLVTGGGKTARHYRDAGKEVIGTLTSSDLDWLGIHASRLNGHLLRTIFQDIAHPRIVENYDKKLKNWKEPVVIGAGWKPGWSTDYDAVVLARDYNAELIINLSNIDWVYDKDPGKYKDAQPIKRMTYDELEKLVGNKWIPGLNAPFDPIALQLAKKLELTIIVANGSNLDNVGKIIEGDAFIGTVVMPYRIDASFYDREYFRGLKGGSRITDPRSFFGKFMGALNNLYRAFIIKTFLNPKNVLDVGCGTGGLVQKMRWLGIDAYGVDYSADALKLADSDVKPYLKQGDILNLPYDKNEFDLVLTYDILQRIERGKLKKAIDETVRVSRKHVLHKLYTKENRWIELFHHRDLSLISIFDKKYWLKIFSAIEHVSIVRNHFFRLPEFFETIFVLRKKNF